MSLSRAAATRLVPALRAVHIRVFSRERRRRLSVASQRRRSRAPSLRDSPSAHADRLVTQIRLGTACPRASVMPEPRHDLRARYRSPWRDRQPPRSRPRRIRLAQRRGRPTEQPCGPSVPHRNQETVLGRGAVPTESPFSYQCSHMSAVFLAKSIAYAAACPRVPPGTAAKTERSSFMRASHVEASVRFRACVTLHSASPIVSPKRT